MRFFGNNLPFKLKIIDEKVPNKNVNAFHTGRLGTKMKLICTENQDPQREKRFGPLLEMHRSLF